MSNAASDTQSNPRPPLSPDVEAHMQKIARLWFDILRDYRDGKLNPSARANETDQARVQQATDYSDPKRTASK